MTERHHLFVSHPYPYCVWASSLAPTHLRLDSLFFGVLLAYFYHFQAAWLEPRVRRYRVLLLWLGIALVCPVAKLPLDVKPGAAIFSLPMLYIGFGSILLAVLYAPAAGFFSSVFARVAAVIGTFSYSIYLWHIALAQRPFMALLAQGFMRGMPSSERWLCGMLLYILLASLTGILLGLLVERPMLILRERLFPRETQAHPVTTRLDIRGDESIAGAQA